MKRSKDIQEKTNELAQKLNLRLRVFWSTTGWQNDSDLWAAVDTTPPTIQIINDKTGEIRQPATMQDAYDCLRKEWNRKLAAQRKAKKQAMAAFIASGKALYFG